MKLLKIKDNSQLKKDAFSDIFALTGKVADKTLDQLEREGVFVFPEYIDDAEDIRPVSADEYNAKRTPGTPCWYTVAVHNHTRRWRGLLEKLELPVFSNVDKPREAAALKVNIFTHFDFRD